jgi:hypothetical protein
MGQRLSGAAGPASVSPWDRVVTYAEVMELDLVYWETRASWLYGMRPLIL